MTNEKNQSDSLRNLFDTLTDEIASRIKNGTASPKDLDVARQLLKDNGYIAKAIPTNPLGKLAEVLPFTKTDDELSGNYG